MSTLSVLRPVRIILYLVLLVSLAGCSRVQLGYEYADWFGARQISKALDLDRGQRRQVQEALSNYREWHRRERLPQLIDLMDRLQALVSQPEPSAAQTTVVLKAFEDEFRSLVSDLLPVMVETLGTLSPAQADHFREQLSESRTEYVERPPDVRRERAIERTEDWTGQLRDTQQALLGNCASVSGIRSDGWLRWRQTKEERLLSLLGNTSEPEQLEQVLVSWFLDEEALPVERWQERQRTRAIWHGCVGVLLSTLDASQRQSVLTRLQGYRDDFMALLPEALQRDLAERPNTASGP